MNHRLKQLCLLLAGFFAVPALGGISVSARCLSPDSARTAGAERPGIQDSGVPFGQSSIAAEVEALTFSAAHLSPAAARAQGMDSSYGAAIDGVGRVQAPLPAAPGSLGLALGGLAGIGIFQVGRGVRKFQISGPPSWYQEFGPGQIGHACPLDLDDFVLPLCPLDEVTPAPAPFVRRIESPRSLRSQAQPLAAAPRGPPLIHS